MFSRRTGWDLAESRTSAVLEAARRGGAAIDLTVSNPTRVELAAAAPLCEVLALARCDGYAPVPQGLESARVAVCDYYATRGVELDPARLVLTASTSEAYGFLFKLLCDPGDSVLVPAPSYPLFGYLAALEHVETRAYPLAREEGFRVDLGELERRIDARTRAVVVVAPNNPTGTLWREDDARALEALAAARGIALIVDEVFVDWLQPAGLAPTLRRSWLGEGRSLRFVLHGLSKLCCAPQLKLGWIAVAGPAALADAALARLELVADTYLSVATPVQRALPELLGGRGALAHELATRLAYNLAALDRAVAKRAGGATRRLSLHGGWTALVELPRLLSEEAWIEALARGGVLVQPGYFFDIEGGRTFAVSLIPEERRFALGVERLMTVVEREIG